VGDYARTAAFLLVVTALAVAIVLGRDVGWGHAAVLLVVGGLVPGALDPALKLVRAIKE
jgi:hypothetical protein